MDSSNKIKILLIFLAINFYSHLYGNDTVYIKFIWNSSATNILQLESISEVDFEQRILIKKEIQKNTILDTFIVIKKEAFCYLKDGFGQHTFFLIPGESVTLSVNEIVDNEVKNKNVIRLKFSDIQIIKAKLSGHLSFFDNVERKYNGILKYNFRENENPILFIKKCNQQLKNYLNFLEHNLKIKTINLKFYDLARSEIFSLYVFSVSSGLYHFNKSKVKGYINDSIFGIKYSSSDLAVNSLYYANAGYLSLIYYHNNFNPVVPFHNLGEKYFSDALQLYSGIALERILSWIIEDCVNDSPIYDSLFLKYKSICKNQFLLNKTAQVVNVKKKKLQELDQFQKVFNELVVENNKGKFQDLRYLLEFKKDIVIDFWATWCKPCLIQSEFLKKIENQLKDKFIFVFLSTDTNRTLWLNYTKSKFDFRRNRFSFLLSDSFNNKLLKVLDLKSIPRYILIDGKTGKLKNANLPLPEYSSAFIEAIHKQ